MDWNIPIHSKWPYVQIESKRRLTRDEMISLVCQMDSTLSGWRHGGNGDHFNNWLWDVARVPEESPNRIPFHGHMMSVYADEDELKSTFNCDDMKVSELVTELYETRELMWDDYEKRVEDWQKGFKRFEDCSGVFDVFSVDLFSSCYIGGPTAWFDWNTGKIGSVGTIGKWPENLTSVKSQLEDFAQRYKDIPVTVSFYEDDLKPITAVLIQNGVCDRVDVLPINKKLMKKHYWRSSPFNYMTKLEAKLLRAKPYMGKEWFFRYDFENSTGEQYFDMRMAYIILAAYQEQLDNGTAL